MYLLFIFIYIKCNKIFEIALMYKTANVYMFGGTILHTIQITKVAISLRSAKPEREGFIFTEYCLPHALYFYMPHITKVA